MKGVTFDVETDEGYVRVEWGPSGSWEGFPKSWDWTLERDGKQLSKLDTYSGTASLGELDPGTYVIRIRAKDEGLGPAWLEERSTLFQVVSEDRVVGETERRLSRVLDAVGELLRERDHLERLLDDAIHDRDLARSSVEVLELQLQSLRALGSQPKDGMARRIWRQLASPAVATLVTITAIPISAYVATEAAQTQAEATLTAGDVGGLDEHLEACLGNSEKLIELLQATDTP